MYADNFPSCSLSSLHPRSSATCFPANSMRRHLSFDSSQWDWASQVIESRSNPRQEERDRLHSRGNDAVQRAGHTLCGKLVKQATNSSRLNILLDRTIADDISPVKRSKCIVTDIAAEWSGVEEVHLQDLRRDLAVAVRVHAVDPVVRQSPLDEERVHRRLVGDIVRSAREEFVEERSGAKEEEGQWAEEEVGVLLHGLIPAFTTIDGEVLDVVETTSRAGHHVEEGAVELEVVAFAGEEVVAGEGGVGFELVMAGKTWLAAGQNWVEGRTCCCLAADGELGGDKVAISLEAEEGEEVGEIVADVIDVLLGVDELGVGDYAITGEKTVVGGSVEARAST